VTGPLRLADDADSDLSLLLRAGQAEAPPRHALQKTLAGLGAATTVVGATHAAGAAVTVGKLGVWTLAKWAGAGLVSGVVAVGGVELVQHGIESSRERAVAVASSTTPAATPAARTAGAQQGAQPLAANMPESEGLPVLPAETRRAGDRHAGAVHPERPPVSGVKPAGPTSNRGAEPKPEEDSTISVEIALIDEARRALQAGRAAAALEALRRHRVEVKRQRLAPEAVYLEMEALFASGNASAAQAAARKLLATYPKGPHAARAQSILASGAP
jgi:TolA-binding protein